MMGFDASSSYFNGAETTLSKQNAGSLKVAWTADMGGNVYGAPLQVADKIYANGPSRVAAFVAETGEELWSTRVISTSSLAYAEDVLYLNDAQGRMVALKASDGSMLWTKAAEMQSSDGCSSPTVAGDSILIGGSNMNLEGSGGGFRGYLSALDRKTGALLWTAFTVPSNASGASLWSSAAADLKTGIAYGATGNNFGTPVTDTSDALIAFDLKAGDILWKNQRIMNDAFPNGDGTDSDFGANPVLYDVMIDDQLTPMISAGSKGGSIHGVRRDTGELVWARELCPGSVYGERGIFTNGAWSGQLMLFACSKNGSADLVGINGANGEIAWMRTLNANVWGRISAANGVGAVGAGASLEVFDTETGAQLKSYPSMGGTVAGTISIAHGRIAYGEGLAWVDGNPGRFLTVLAP
jgi:polyvinyl alcohol dehydrogenase (cytochrome)